MSDQLVPQASPSHLDFIPPVHAIEELQPERRPSFMARYGGVLVNLTAGAVLTVCAVYEAGQAGPSWPNTSVEECSTDYDAQVPTSMQEIRESVAQTEFLFTQEEYDSAQELMMQATDHEGVDEAVTTLLQTRGITYLHNTTPRIGVLNEEIPDALLMPRYTEEDTQTAKLSALNLLRSMKNVRAVWLEALDTPVTIYHTRDYTDALHRHVGGAWAAPNNGPEGGLAFVINTQQPGDFAELVFGQLAEHCDIEAYDKSGDVEIMSEDAEAMLRALTPRYDAEQVYIDADTTDRVLSDLAKQADPTTECFDHDADIKIITVEVPDPAGNGKKMTIRVQQNGGQLSSVFAYGYETTVGQPGSATDKMEEEVRAELQTELGLTSISPTAEATSSRRITNGTTRTLRDALVRACRTLSGANSNAR